MKDWPTRLLLVNHEKRHHASLMPMVSLIFRQVAVWDNRLDMVINHSIQCFLTWEIGAIRLPIRQQLRQLVLFVLGAF
jgi:hypothetical protein